MEKSSTKTGWKLFHAEQCKLMLEEESADENVEPPTLGEMVKISSEKWRSLDQATRKRWIKKGQRVREAEDRGIVDKR